MTKFKAGDEVRKVGAVAIFVEDYGSDTSMVTDVADEWICVNGDWWHSSGFELVEQWSIYSNTKPLGELTDDQAGKLLKHTGPKERMMTSTMSWVHITNPNFVHAGIYRAKKSERELFIEAADYYIDCGDEPTVIAGKMFDAGFKAPSND